MKLQRILEVFRICACTLVVGAMAGSAFAQVEPGASDVIVTFNAGDAALDITDSAGDSISLESGGIFVDYQGGFANSVIIEIADGSSFEGDLFEYVGLGVPDVSVKKEAKNRAAQWAAKPTVPGNQLHSISSVWFFGEGGEEGNDILGSIGATGDAGVRTGAYLAPGIIGQDEAWFAANVFVRSQSDSQTDLTDFSVLTQSNGHVVVVAVPEPSTWVLLGLGSLAIVGFVRRRNS